MSPRIPCLVAAAGLSTAVMSLTGQDQPDPTPPQRVTLFTNVRIFDGKSPELSAPMHVLIRGNLIEKISATPIPTDRRADTTIIDGSGKTLMPGLIDAHVHTMMESIPLTTAIASDISYITLVASRAASRQLQRGFTSVRDLGGASFSLKTAIDQGLCSGPRIYPSGAAISQTGGHGDFRLPNEVPEDPAAPLTYMERTGMTIIADGPDEVLKRTREQLRNGASQVKLMAGGGVSSSYDPLDVTQYSPAELSAAVSAAENWGTYVSVHAYTPKAIRTAIDAGVKCIEHGQLIDDATAKLLAEKGIWWSLQPFVEDPAAPSAFPKGSPNRLKQELVHKGTEIAYGLARKYNIKTAFGTDMLFSPPNASTQGSQLSRLTKWYSTAEILTMATSGNAELLNLSGPRNPYPGKLGVVTEGALADLLLVNGNPLENIQLFTDPANNLSVIMKNGVDYKEHAH
jgi:imidazolonepropionase-like amidohydrolase